MKRIIESLGVTCASLLALSAMGSLGGCHEEPAIVITFHPQDLAVAPPTTDPRRADTPTPSAAPAAGPAAGTSAPTAPSAAPAAAPTAGTSAPTTTAKRADATPAAVDAAAPGAPKADETRCARDSDCVKVQEGCCGCTAGGKATAIARSFEKRYLARLADRCGTSMCVQVMSTDPSCRMEPACRGGRCVLVETAAPR